MMHTVYLGLGSNMGDKLGFLQMGVTALEGHPEIQVKAVSSLYQTSPVGGVEQDDFVNMAVKVTTNLEANALLEAIHRIEAQADRKREIHWGPRTLDIDILYYDQVVSEDPQLTLPHPEIMNRLFVLRPLMDIVTSDFYQKEAIESRIPQLEAETEQRLHILKEKIMTQHDNKKIEEHVRQILIEIGEDPDREGLVETPKRVAKALREMLSSTTKEEFTEYKMFPTETSPHTEMVTVNNITFYSMCEHHMLPFFGKVHVAYIPKGGQIIGLSKIPRLVNYASRKLNVQENITREVAETLFEVAGAAGVGVVVDARHMCVEMRGVSKPEGVTRTTYFLGDFEDDPSLRREFLQTLPTPW